MKRSDIKRRPLSDTALVHLAPEPGAYRELDSSGLYFRVKPNGQKSWELRYKKPDGKWSWVGQASQRYRFSDGAKAPWLRRTTDWTWLPSYLQASCSRSMVFQRTTLKPSSSSLAVNLRLRFPPILIAVAIAAPTLSLGAQTHSQNRENGIKQTGLFNSPVCFMPFFMAAVRGKSSVGAPCN